MNLNGTEYYYIKNAQDDIIGLIDKAGTQVTSYTYDTYGKVISIDGSLKDTVGKINPYRYREYRYDSEAGLYYLQSRYYNAEWGRFVNADDTEQLNNTNEDLFDYNSFVYCNNNPVNKVDSDGRFAAAAGVVYFVPGLGEIALGVTGLIILGYGAYKGISYLKSKAKNISFAKASDSSKNEKHGDSGRAMRKAEKQIKQLEEKLRNTTSRKEKQKIKNKIRKIREDAQKKLKGESHSQAEKR